MRDLYHDELDAVTDELVEMIRLVGGAVERATMAVLGADLATAEAVIGGDLVVDARYADVEARAMDLLARQQPVASDLRMLVAGLRMVADIERMGDYAVNIAKVARLRYPSVAVPDPVAPVIRDMGLVATGIADKCAVVVGSRNVRLAAELEADDDRMDALHRRMFTLLLDPGWAGDVERAIDATACSRYYERFCDHAVSVARRVIYLVTGDPVHATEQ